MEDELQSAKKIVLTCDGWTSWTTEFYVTITAHFIDNKWEMHLYVLQMRGCMRVGHENSIVVVLLSVIGT